MLLYVDLRYVCAPPITRPRIERVHEEIVRVRYLNEKRYGCLGNPIK